MNVNMSGMVIFPVTYVVTDDYKQSYVIARDLNNKFVKVHICPNEKAVQRSNSGDAFSIPLVSEFAKTGRHARNPCYADKKNSKNNPVGILLCEQVQKVQDSEHKGYSFPTFTAKWASVLRIDTLEPTPGLGIGFFEVAYTYPKDQPQKNIAAINQMIKGFVEKANSPIINPLERSEILTREAELIFNTRAKRYSAMIIKHNEIVENISVTTPKELRTILESSVQKYTVDGRYGVALIRVRRGNVVNTSASTRFSMEYNYSERRINTDEENWHNFRKYQLNNLYPFIKDPAYSIDIIPCQRIYFGPKGVGRFNKEFMPVSPASVVNPPSKWMKQFIDKKYHVDPTVDLVKKQAFLASFIGVRVARESGGQQNHLASTIHSVSKVVCPAIAIKSDLSAYQLDTDENNTDSNANAA